jgi:voltage-gated potassium channel
MVGDSRDNRIEAATSSRVRRAFFRVIFESDDPQGKAFDVALILAIALNVVLVMAESIATVRDQFGTVIRVFEWGFTGIFVLEYLLRAWCVRDVRAYLFSFFGIVDLVAVLPAFIGLLVPVTQYLVVIRALRILRVFRVLKVVPMYSQASLLMRSLRASRHKISVFLFTVVILVCVIGSLMYMIEGEENGFTSIPRAVYWAIVTMTTVGYGDLSPQTAAGQTLAAIIMIVGYSIIAVPTGIVTAEIAIALGKGNRESVCSRCGLRGHQADARYCRNCGTALATDGPRPGKAPPASSG